ncbi:AraC-like DNA-binding protein [Chryseobacterium sp. H1D6B]|nr:AraC-like DNA-binding protein [Chryseobacterium sp. H1D6B]
MTRMNLKPYEKLQETLSFYGVDCHRPYYISSGNSIFKFPQAPFRIDFYALCICTSGNIKVEIDSTEYSISENGFLVCAPSTIIKFLYTSGDFRMKLLFFDKNFLLKNISNPFFIDQLALFRNSTFSVIRSNETQSQKLFRLLSYLQDASKRTGCFSQDIIRTIIFNLLLETAEIVDTEKNEQENDLQKDNCLFFKFTELTQNQITKHKDVQYYADQLFVSSKHLISIVKKASGKTPHEIIDDYLLKEAYVQLGNPEKTISDISYDIGFSSLSAFGRFFKKYAFLSPSEYRKQQLF